MTNPPDIDRATWIAVFTSRLIELSQESRDAEKIHFACDYGFEIARLYLAGGELARDPREAAAFEYGCWAWWSHRGITGADATHPETDTLTDGRAVPD